MLSTSINVDEVLSVVDNAIKPVYLNKVQELVLRQTLEGKTYSEIASSYCYDSEYIKSVGCELWQLLSKSFGEQVNKSNFQQFIRRYVTSSSYVKAKRVPILVQAAPAKKLNRAEMLNSLEQENQIQRHQDWGTSPDVSTFQGRAEELAQLVLWSNNDRCRLAIIYGLIGCGKTALAAKFAEQVQQQFDCVIWRSLRNAPPVEEILDTLVRFFSNDKVAELPSTLNEKNSLLLHYLRQNRCLIILDDLQSVLDSSGSTTQYRPGYEGYGQLLRSIVSTHHQSFVVATSWDKPSGLTLYEGEQVQSQVLRGLEKSALKEIFQGRVTASESEKQLQLLMERYAYNPQFLKIAISTIEKIFHGSVTQFLQQKSPLLDDIRTLLDRQFDRLSDLEKRIAYWLAIERSVMVEQLATQVMQPVSTTKFLESLVSLEERSLVKKEASSYVLHPLILEYLSCKLIEKIWEGDFTDKISSA